MLRERLRSGHSVLVAAFGPDGPLAAGSCQAVDGVAEITGVGVLPSSRRQRLGAAVTALLARDALDRGVPTVFLSASDDAVARVYARIGFREIGTAMIAEPAPDLLAARDDGMDSVVLLRGSFGKSSCSSWIESKRDATAGRPARRGGDTPRAVSPRVLSP